MICYNDEVFPVLMSMMKDKSQVLVLFKTNIRLSAIQSMIAVVSSTGFCVLPFYQYPDLQNTILQLLNIENSSKIKVELLKLFGCLGAIDSFTHKKVFKFKFQITNRLIKQGKDIKITCLEDLSANGLRYQFQYLKNQNKNSNKKQELQIE